MCKKQKTTRKQSANFLVHFDKTPHWLQDNDYIRNYYRLPMSVWQSLKTALFGLHNETMNIYTHLIGFFCFVGITWFTLAFLSSLKAEVLPYEKVSSASNQVVVLLETPLRDGSRNMLSLVLTTKKVFRKFLEFFVALAANGYSSFHLKQVNDYWSQFQDSLSFFRNFPFAFLEAPWIYWKDNTETLFEDWSELFWTVVYEHQTAMLPLLLGACACLFCSTIFHMFFNVSERCFKGLSRLDYAGIVFLTVGHSLVGTYYTLYCLPSLARVYYIAISIAGLLTLGVTLYPAFDSPKNRLTRAWVFVSFGTISGLPILHAGWIHGFHHIEYWHHAKYMFLMAGFYLLGALFFATRWPERWSPGKFDLFFNSHNLMHICVLIAAFIHWYGCMESCIYRLHRGCTFSPIL
eukprot:jgi/Galph1/3871/GphlegSOOS_G2517.1